jgi:peroxiredoxin
MALLEVGTTAPPFRGQNLTGPEFNLDKLKGCKPVLLIFPPDQINPSQTNQTKVVYDKNRNDVEFVVMTRQLPSVVMAKAFLQQLGVRFPVIYDPKQEIYRMYGVEKPAVVYAIKRDGTIAAALEFEPRAMNPAALQGAIDSAK